MSTHLFADADLGNDIQIDTAGDDITARCNSFSYHALRKNF